MTPIEELAAREGWPVVTLTPMEALRVAAGYPMRCRTVDGANVLLRLATADEALDMNARARAELEAQGLPAAPPMTPAEAVRVTTPVGGPR